MKKFKLQFLILGSAIFIMATFIISVGIGYTSYQAPTSTEEDNPPPPPTPGPEPTSMPETLENAISVATQEEAIEQLLLLDVTNTEREEPLTIESLAKDVSLLTLLEYETRQDAAKEHDLGYLTDEERASEPVWVAIIHGEVTVHTMKGPVKTNEVTYVFSKETGYLLNLSTGKIID